MNSLVRSEIDQQLDPELVAMAADPEIQAELRRIEEEFASTEADGLEHWDESRAR